MQVTVKTPGTKASSVQLYRRSIPLDGKTDYELSFWAKASEACSIAANGMQGVAPFTVYSEPEVAITTEWKQYSISFTVGDSTGDGRVSFTRMGLGSRTYWFGGVHLTKKGLANTNPDALRIRVRAELAVFTDWLKANNVKGYIGETGWPDNRNGDASRWNAVAEAWFQDANAAQLWVTCWATGVRWGNTYFAQPYTQSSGAPGIDTPNTQAQVIEANLDPAKYARGVNVAGADFGDASGQSPGVYGVDYNFDPPATYQYLGSRKLNLVRIPFRWERIQTKLMGDLDSGMLGHMKEAVAAARKAGLYVVLDMHNYASYAPQAGVTYKIGTEQLPYAAFVDVWRKISLAFKDEPGVYYGLMNEPVDIPAQQGLKPAQVWEKASQMAVDAIRQNGDTKTIMVAGYFWSSAVRWPENHPKAWIKDSANNFRYEAHHYFDSDNSGTYKHSYQDDLADAQKRGYGADHTATAAR